MKKLLKNLVLGLVGLVLLATLTTGVSAAPNLIVSSTASVSDDAEVLDVVFTVNNDGATFSDTFTVVVSETTSPSNGVINTQTITTGAVELSPGANTVSVPVTLNTANLDADETSTISVTVTGTTVSGSGSVTLSVTESIPDDDTPLAMGLIDDVDFDDKVAPGDDVSITVTLKTADNERYDDVTIEVWIEDSTGDRITDREETNEFNIGKVDDDDSEERTLTVSIPSDTEEDTYNWVVSVVGEAGIPGTNSGFVHLLDVVDQDTSSTNVKSKDIEIDVERDEHSLTIEQVDFDSTVRAGDSVDFAVDILNNGQSDESDVRVSVTISDVGVSQTSRALTIEEDEETTAYFTLTLPQTMSTGEYVVTVRASNDDVTVSGTYGLSVSGTATQPTTDGQPALIVSADATSKSVGSAGAVYAVTLINNGNSARTFSLEIAGADNWAQTSVNPATVVVGAGSSELVSVFVSPLEGTTGTNQFTVFVNEGGAIVDSLGLTARVTGAGATQVDLGDLNTGLKYIVGFLIVVLVVLFVMWNWNREETKGKGSKVY